MDHIRANPGFPGRCVSCTKQKNGSSEIGRFEDTSHAVSRLLSPPSADVDLQMLDHVAQDKEKIMLKKTTFAVVARIRGVPEKADELRRRLLDLVRLTRNENGCLSCDMIQNGCDLTEFTLLEEWSQEKEYKAHFSTDRIQDAMKLIPSLLSRELDSHKHVLRPNSVRYGTNSYCLAIS